MKNKREKKYEKRESTRSGLNLGQRGGHRAWGTKLLG